MRTLQLEHEIMREDLDNKEYGQCVRQICLDIVQG